MTYISMTYVAGYSDSANSEQGGTEGEREMKFHSGKIIKQRVRLKIPNGVDDTAF